MKYIFSLFLLVSTFFSVQAQVETKYYASPQHSAAITRAKELARNSVVHRMPAFDVSELLKEDSILAGMDDIPYRFGKDFPLSVTLEDGEWHPLDNGRVWTMTFESIGALSLNFIFDNFHLPEGATLEIMNEAGSVFYGPVRANAIPQNGHFMTDLISGEKVTIYLHEPFEVIGQSTLTISRLIHGYKGLTLNRNYGAIGESSDCNVDVACHQEYSQEAKAVALVMLANGKEWCSGSLLMSTDLSFKPYFLTAFHCIDSNQNGSLSNDEITNAENWLFKFNFKREVCGDTALSVSTTYNSAIFRAAWVNTDFALMEINQDLKSNTSLYWLGWDRSGNTPTNGAGIHHPKGDLMKISVEDDAFSTVCWNGINSTNEYNHWGVNYDEGITQEGSSGSPLFNQNHKVVGQLHGGPHYADPCFQTYNKYGKFNISWTGTGTNDTRLSNWLDPIGTNQTVIDGSDYLSSLQISGPAIPCGTSSYFVPNISTPYTVTWSWKYSSNSVPITQNSPSANQCTITNNSHAYIKNTLVATISKNNTIVKTIEKDIDTGANFSGTCSQAGYSYPGWLYSGTSSHSFTSGGSIRLFKGPTITLSSSDFIGANITYSGTTPLDWTNSNGVITFHFKYLPPINPLDPPSNRAQSLGGDAELVITGTYPNSCETFQFTVIGTEPLDPISPMSSNGNTDSGSCQLSVQNTGSSYTFSIVAANSEVTGDASEADSGRGSNEDYIPWHLTITHSITGNIVYSNDIRDSAVRIDTSDWPSGIYVVQAKVGTEVLTQKICITR